MNSSSRILYKGHGYTAAVSGFQAHGGPFLSVTRGERGVYLSGAEAVKWTKAIEDEVKEAQELAEETGFLDHSVITAYCRTIYNS